VSLVQDIANKYVVKEITMTQDELIAFLKANLSLRSHNTIHPYNTSDNFTIQLVLGDEVISTQVLHVNNGIVG
jgi:hypothetical protein